MLLSIGMMVKNESKYLRKCLESLQPIREAINSELIIVDTGSTDNTVEIAKEFTDKVYYHEWNDNFSEMRNITINYSIGEWFLVIDGDEVISNPNGIIQFFSFNEYKSYNAACVSVKNFSFIDNEEDYSVLVSPRIFKRDGYFHFEGAVHNQPKFKQPVLMLNSELLHYGYISNDKKLMERKFQRTANILKNELKNDPENIYYLFQLSVSYAMHGDFEEALEPINNAYNIIKLKKFNPNDYLYVYGQLAKVYFKLCKYKETEKICLEIIQQDNTYIDLRFYLAKAQFMMNKNNESIENYNIYLEKVKNYNVSKMTKNITIINDTLGKYEAAYLDLSILYDRIEEFETALEFAKKIQSPTLLSSAFNLIIILYVKLNKFNELKNYYDSEILINNVELKDNFLNCLEKYVMKINPKKREKVNEIFTQGNTEYSLLNKLRIGLENEHKDLLKNIKELDFNKLPNYYGDILYYLLCKKVPLKDFLSKINEFKIKSYFNFLFNKYDDLGIKIYEYLVTFKSSEKTFDDIRINKILAIYLFKLNYMDDNQDIDDNKYMEMFNYYLEYGYYYLEQVYNSNIIKDKLVYLIKDEEDLFLMYMHLAKECKEDRVQYLRNLRTALSLCNYMKKGIKILSQEIPQDLVEHSDEMNEYRKKVKEAITKLINDNNLVEAKKFIDEYENIVKNDLEIYSIKAVIAIMENRLEDAEIILKDGLNIDDTNFDLNYNLAYLYEETKEFHKALKYYKKAENYCNDDEIRNQIIGIMDKMKLLQPNVVYEKKLKLVFFVKQGMDSFLSDIVEGLSDEYETKKIIVTEFNQIDQGMKWADICWFEWCDELVAYGSKSTLAKDKKIICRLHSYEAFSEYPNGVNWDNVDNIIFVAQHIRAFVVEKLKIDKSKTSIIPNGIDIKKYTFKERKSGFNIAYVGYINYKKGPMLLFHTFKAIYDKDSRYKLYIAGQFQDDRDVLYFRQMIKEFGIENNVFYEGWQDNLDDWLEDKNYILCTSVLESQNMSVMQAMAKGIKPIVHNFVGAKGIYSNHYVWNTVNEAVEMVLSNEYSSKEYWNYIKNNYSLNKMINSINNLLLNLPIFSKQIVEIELSNLKNKFNTNSDDIQNTEKLFDAILENGMDEEYMKYLAEWFVRSKYDLTSRFNYYYNNIYRKFSNYNRFQYIDKSSYIEMEQIGEGFIQKYYNKYFKDGFSKYSSKKKVLILSNGMDIKQTVVKFNFEYIINSDKSNFEYYILSVLNKNEFSNYNESIEFLNSNGINYFIPCSNNIEDKMKEFYKYISEIQPDVVIFQSLYFSPISVLLYPLFNKLNILIGAFIHQQPENYFHEKIDFVITFFDYYPGLKYKDNFNMLLPIKTDIIDKNLNIRNEIDIDSGKKVIVSIGRAIKYSDKNFWKYVVKSANEIDNICFVFFGFTYDSFRDLVPENLVMDKTVNFCGFNPSAVSYLKSCDIYLNSPLSGGVSFSEAYYAGIPIITFFKDEYKNYFTIEDLSNTAPRNYYNKAETIFPKPGNYDGLFDLTKRVVENGDFTNYIRSLRKFNGNRLKYVSYINELEKFMIRKIDNILRRGIND